MNSIVNSEILKQEIPDEPKHPILRYWPMATIYFEYAMLCFAEENFIIW